MEKGVPIRSVSRFISVLQAVNRGGAISIKEISREARVPYPTAARVVQSLISEGLLERESDRKRYRPTALVHTLSHGYQSDNDLVTAARPIITDLTRRIAWPVAVTTRVGHQMMLRDSTHTTTSLTFDNYYPGFSMPLLESASGQVYLAFCGEDEARRLVEDLSEIVPDQLARMRASADHLVQQLRDIRAQGYACAERNRFTATPGKTSSIAVPLLADGCVTGALTMSFFVSAMSMAEAVSRFRDNLAAAAHQVSSALAGRDTVSLALPASALD